jgi:hypothetical protein
VSSYARNVPLLGAAVREHAGERELRFAGLPWIILAASAGVAAASAADALSRSGRSGGSELFWLAVVLIMGPAAMRMAAKHVPGGERAATVVVVGLALYAVKVLRDPWSFTYADELVHYHNLQAILASGNLFGGNTILPITPRYPGLESAAAAIARAGGISPFAAGIMLIAAARVVLMLALYLFYERVSGSPRAAGIGALAYAATPTFLFFSAQFSYESLALPLATVAVLTLLSWGQASDRATRWRWGALLLLVAAAVVPTHHVSAYALVAFLAAVCVLHWLLHGRRGAPWAMAGSIAVLSLGWLVFAAAGTIGYLAPVIASAINKVVQTLNGEAQTRVLFANQGGVEQTPVGERIIAIAGILVLALGVLGGLRVVWRQRARNPMLVLLALSGAAYIATLPLRLVPAAWETASRAGEFLFLGVGLTVSIGVVWLLDRRGQEPRLFRLLVAGGLALVFGSGVIAGWPASLRLALPLRVEAAGHVVEPPGFVAARWSGTTLGAGQRVAAEDSDARLFIDYGHQIAFAGVNPDFDGMLSAPTLQPWVSLLRDSRITLVETDRRQIAADIIAGYFFDEGAPALMSAASANKFNVANVNRLYDSGNLVIYGVRRLW